MAPPPLHPQPVRVGTRSSPLALAQARAVAEALGAPAELVPITTRGDRANSALTAIGGKGLFTAELEAALRRGDVHLAVHSAKDLPAAMAEDMVVAAVPAREDARDALISPEGKNLADLPGRASVGTSSLRRAAQVRALRPDVRVRPLRGNVQTRIRKLRRGEFDAVIVAMAGLRRLGLTDELAGLLRPLEIDQFVPAAGQGALAVQCLASDASTRRLLDPISDEDSAAALSAERQVVRRLGASCHSALGVHVYRTGGGWGGLAVAADADAARILRADADGADAPAVAEKLIRRLTEAGGAELIRP